MTSILTDRRQNGPLPIRSLHLQIATGDERQPWIRQALGRSDPSNLGQQAVHTEEWSAFGTGDVLEPVLGKVLIVDSDSSLRPMISEFLEGHNAMAVYQNDWSRVPQELLAGEFDLLIMDVELSGKDGLELLRLIRSLSNIPVIIVTSEGKDEADRIRSLELGADDYLTKPVGLHEVLARARATLRRQEIGRRLRLSVIDRGGYRFSNWEVRRRARALINPQGEVVSLTKTEFSLLASLLEADGRILTRQQLLHATRTNEDIYDRSIDVQILRLRRKVEAGAPSTRIIVTARGLGYRIGVPIDRFY